MASQTHGRSTHVMNSDCFCSTCESIQALVSGLAPSRSAGRLLGVYQAFIDDSGRGQGPVLVLAGFCASVETWRRFSNDWQTVLDEEPSLAYFKTQEAMNRVGQFSGWTIEDRNRRLDNFVTVVTNHLALAICVITPLKAYNAVFRGRIAKGMDDPYWLTFYTIMMGMLRYELDIGIREKVDFIFDEQKGKSALVQKFWDTYVEVAPDEAKPLIGGRPIHRSDLEFLPLQAADLIAWHIRRNQHEMRLHGRPYKTAVGDRLSKIKLIGTTWTKPMLRELFNRVRRKYVFPYDVDRRGLGGWK